MERDFLCGPTVEELSKYKELVGKDYYDNSFNGFRPPVDLRLIPEACRRCKELFPNQWLDFVESWDTKTLKPKFESFKSFVSTVENEQQILNYIKDNKLYCAIGSILKAAAINTGHHASYVFPEFQLSNVYRADYLIIGRGSGGYEFIFVEFESPNGNIFLQDGSLGSVVRKGLNQVDDWNRFLQSNFTSLLSTFEKHKSRTTDLPKEFYTYDSSRIHYVVVAGRRSDYTEKSYRIRREYKQRNDISILHYDNIVDSFEFLINNKNY